MKFEDWFVWKGFARRVLVCWDHVIPYSFGFDSSAANFVAACGQCNGIKSSKLFDDLQQLVDYVRTQRTKRGLPLRTMWGDIHTQKGMAKILWVQVSERLLLGDPCSDPEAYLADCKEFRKLHRRVSRA